jgi:hypothetical protein
MELLQKYGLPDSLISNTTTNLSPSQIKANSHIPCRSPAALIHANHAAPLPFSDSAVSFVKVHVVDGKIRTASEIGMLLVTTFVELRVVAEESRTRAGSPHAVSGRPMLKANSHIP